jgi:hypothetical protein
MYTEGAGDVSNGSLRSRLQRGHSVQSANKLERVSPSPSPPPPAPSPTPLAYAPARTAAHFCPSYHQILCGPPTHTPHAEGRNATRASPTNKTPSKQIRTQGYGVRARNTPPRAAQEGAWRINNYRQESPMVGWLVALTDTSAPARMSRIKKRRFRGVWSAPLVGRAAARVVPRRRQAVSAVTTEMACCHQQITRRTHRVQGQYPTSFLPTTLALHNLPCRGDKSQRRVTSWIF